MTLSTGKSVTATDAYLSSAIAHPDADIVKGYPGQVMAQTIAAFDLKDKPAEVRALVAYIKTTR